MSVRLFPDDIIIGSDQTMSLGARVYHKPRDMNEARDHLLSLSGQVHQLNSGIVLTRGNDILWKHVSSARMSVRALRPDFIDAHLARVGKRALASVGAYQLEGEGIQLFDKIDGDYFTILGLPHAAAARKTRDLRCDRCVIHVKHLLTTPSSRAIRSSIRALR